MPDFRRSHPSVPATDVLDVYMRLRSGSFVAVSGTREPNAMFATLVRQALNRNGDAWPNVIERLADRDELRR